MDENTKKLEKEYNQLKKEYLAKTKKFEKILDIGLKRCENMCKANNLIRNVMNDLRNMDSITQECFRGVKTLDNDMKKLKTNLITPLHTSTVLTNFNEGSRF